jgi:hypothetical protein
VKVAATVRTDYLSILRSIAILLWLDSRLEEKNKKIITAR